MECKIILKLRCMSKPLSVPESVGFFMEMKFQVLALPSSFQPPLDVTDRCLLKQANYLCT